MQRGKNYVDVWIRENEYDYTAYKTLVEWEYDPNGGSETCKHWFDCWVLEYDKSLNENQKNQIDEELRDMDIEDIMITD
jgi:hypothetical protein